MGLRPGMRTNLLLLLGSLVVALGLGALAGEWVLRYRERHLASAPGSTGLQFYRHRRLVYALVRNFDYFGWVHVNGQGFRGPEVSVDKPPGTLRIMTVGESTTFDRFVSRDAAAWPARLQFWLGDLAPGRSFEVINAGTPGYRVMDNLIRLETDLYRYRPDVILFYHGHNDLFAAVQQAVVEPPPPTDRPDETTVVTPWGHWLKNHSLLYNKITSRLQFDKVYGKARQRQAAGSWTPEMRDRVLETGARQFERDVTMFVEVARSLGIRVFLVEIVHLSGVGASSEPDSVRHTTWANNIPFAPPDVMLAGYRMYDETLRSVGARLSVPFVPTAGFGLSGSEWYMRGDPIHFNDHGADRMARALAEVLLADGLKAQASAP